MKKSLLLLLSIGFFSISHAQKEANHWYFGEGAGLDFSSGVPVVDPFGQMDAMHGCAVANSEEGNLLFYTNGLKIWNRDHLVMPNGYLPDSCMAIYTFQNCLTIPKVGSENQFYVFTVQPLGYGNKGLSYHVVDMSLDGGKGDVIETSVWVTDSLLAGYAVTRHSNQTDYWLVVRGITLISNMWHEKWNTFLINENGITLTSSFLGERIFINFQKTGKFSPNGQLLYWGSRVYDFDNTTGEVTSFRDLLPWWLSYYAHGEFSPNNQVLYVLNSGSTGYTLDQFDLNAVDLEGSKIAIDLETDGQVHIKGEVQLGPDGKIYVSYLGNIGVIHEPDNLGVSCNLEQNSIFCGGSSKWSFPNFSSHIFNTLSVSAEEIVKDKEDRVNIYPNPAHRAFYIKQESFEYTSFELMDSSLKLLDKGKITNQNERINVSHLPPGLYLLRLNADGLGVANKKIIIF